MAASALRAGLFEGRVALVTGGGTGIGKAIASELLSLGCAVVIASRSLDRLQQAATQLVAGRSNKKILALQCNIRKEAEVARVVGETLRHWGRLDYLVNNGGGQFPSPAANISAKGWHAVVETNLTGTFLMSREVYLQWMRLHGGAIVNVIADMWNGMPGMSHSGAARAGVENLTKTLAVEWAGSGVRVNAVAPGRVWSPSAAANYSTPDLLLSGADVCPARRVGTVEEVAGPVCFLLSDAAAYITGAVLRIDGGSSLWSPGWPIEHHDNFLVFGASPPQRHGQHDSPSLAVLLNAETVPQARACQHASTAETEPPRGNHASGQPVINENSLFRARL